MSQKEAAGADIVMLLRNGGLRARHTSKPPREQFGSLQPPKKSQWRALLCISIYCTCVSFVSINIFFIKLQWVLQKNSWKRCGLGYTMNGVASQCKLCPCPWACHGPTRRLCWLKFQAFNLETTPMNAHGVSWHKKMKRLVSVVRISLAKECKKKAIVLTARVILYLLILLSI